MRTFPLRRWPMKSCWPAFSFLPADSVRSKLQLLTGRIMSAVPARRRMQIDRLLTAAVMLFLFNIPFFYLYFKHISQTIAPRESVWRQIRIASSKANISGQATFPIEPLILPFLGIIALIAVYEWADTGRRSLRTLCLVLLAGAYQLLNGARSEVLLLLISSVVIR